MRFVLRRRRSNGEADVATHQLYNCTSTVFSNVTCFYKRRAWEAWLTLKGELVIQIFHKRGYENNFKIIFFIFKLLSHQNASFESGFSFEIYKTRNRIHVIVVFLITVCCITITKIRKLLKLYFFWHFKIDIYWTIACVAKKSEPATF